jgi:hypothetical protein
MNNCTLEYIASGNSHVRISFPEAHEDPDCLAYLKKSFHELNTFSPNHKFSLLANAWTEQSFASRFEHFRPAINQIMLDSGGLQIITQGLTITEEMKEKVYEIQSEYANDAMSFDVIPISMGGDGTSDRNCSTSKWFDITKFEECAKESGKNIARQIEVFLDDESKAKPFLITQGNDLDTFCKWTELALKEIPKSHQKHIKGVAMGSPALGFGAMEDMKKAFYFTQLPIETNNLHILGAGSIRRLLPFMIMTQNGMYKDLHISYDSSTHTSGINMGRYYMNAKNMKFPKKIDNNVWPKIQADINQNGFGFGETLEMFHKPFSMPSKDYEVIYGTRGPFIKSINSMFCSSVKNFMSQLDRCFDNKRYLINTLSNKDKNNYLMLYKLKTVDDFLYWEKEIGRHVDSKGVGSSERIETNIEDLF